ncbi:HAD-IIIC family phosphatase [Symbioplanes lichenis]|uniref:HAD-IIIC family phosphatase n=1 Tax=Symbioplanes lichenis TaxID=1629072 RepID=UPI0027399CDB|nr:HAD-IIIC family phosphatase [Actinoplanes lichenis]
MTGIVKCLVWDLDDTLWRGVVLEGDRPAPLAAAVTTLRELDRRGILHAVASRGHPAAATRHLADVGLAGLFCAVEVGWADKSHAVRRIAETLNIGLGTLAFVDNDPVELAEVARALPDVRCYPATAVAGLPTLPEFQPIVTEEARRRREMYQVDRRRRTAEEEWAGPSADFLASLELVMTVRPGTEADLNRAHELTVRTHQLNSTGITYGPDELRRLCDAEDHEVTVAELADRFGSYGMIGLGVTRLTASESVLELLLMSCRVVSRGAGAVLLDHLVHRALAAGRQPVARFVPTPVNRLMLVTLRFAGFEVAGRDGDQLRLAVPADRPPRDRPSYMRVIDHTGGAR